MGDWPEPEVADNINTDELGNLGLNKKEETLIVMFMQTLSDGYKPENEMASTETVTSLKLTGPNPFNPSTTVTYFLQEANQVRLYVYNVAGQRVATLVDGWKEAGEHRLTFKADNLSSGVYFMRLVTSNRTLTTKAILLK